MIDENEFFSITTDGWTSLANNSITDINIHHISKDFVFHNNLIAFKPIGGSHTAANICKWLTDELRRWKLEDKVVTATTDGMDF
jgi:hypothetical protein